MNATIGWIIAAVIVIGGAFYAIQHNKSTSESMMQGETMTDTVMKDDASMGSTSDAMMKDGQSGSMNDDSSVMLGEDVMMKSGSYEAYAPEKLMKADSGKVVLFFRAAWCPTCKAVDADIRAHLSAIPSALTILDVDYDNSTALKQKYGVTYQHTFVQVRADGTMIKKWSASPTLATLSAEVQ